ncbi:RRS1 domain containing protein [Lactarius tabidus]
MDISDILAFQVYKLKSTIVKKDIPLNVDAGFLTVTDTNPIDKESYEYSTARDGVQLLLAALFNLPTLSSPEGPLTQHPLPTTQLPRTKPLPKSKPPTKWECIARAKGIQSQRRDKKIWDDERQTWETQWLREVPANADADYDLAKEARAKHKGRKVIDRTLAMTRTSTASMGKFDRVLDGEKKLRGVKLKFDPIEKSVDAERIANMALLKQISETGRYSGMLRVVNVCKAVQFTSGGQGAAALARKSGSDGRQKRKGKR